MGKFSASFGYSNVGLIGQIRLVLLGQFTFGDRLRLGVGGKIDACLLGSLAGRQALSTTRSLF